MAETDLQTAQMLAACVAASDAAMVVAGASDDFPIVYVNPAFETLTGYQSGDVLGRNCRFLQGPETDPSTVTEFGQRLRDGRPVRLRVLNYRAAGNPFWCECHVSAVRDAAGAVVWYIGVLHDATDDVADRERVAHAAARDPLTGLMNRVSFAAETERELVRSVRHGRSVGVLFLDVDQFKQVNDSYGHAVGDAYLTHVADTLSARLRGGDVAARHGGDEFTVLLTDLPDVAAADAAAQVVADLEHALARPFTADGAEHQTTVTIGTALYPRDGDTLHELVASADAHMYRRKPPRTGPPD